VNNYQPQGVIPACLLPFDSTLQIDEQAYRNHLRDVASVEGISAVTVNGHASEVHALTLAEQQRVLEITLAELGDRLPVIAGVYATASVQAARIATMAETAGAAALLIFPPESMTLGGEQRPEIALRHVQCITDASELPLILFQYPQSSRLGYPLETLLTLCRRYPAIAAIKDWCNDPVLHERQIRTLHALEQPVRVLTTHSAWLLASLVLGCDGILSGAGSVIANLHVALWQAISAGDLARAQAVNERIYPTVRAFYDPPLLDMHNRMKEALVLLRRWQAAHVRPPLVKLDASEIAGIGHHLAAAQLTAETLYRPIETATPLRAGSRRLG